MLLGLKIGVEDADVELYRADFPHAKVQNFIDSLKIFTNGIMKLQGKDDLASVLDPEHIARQSESLRVSVAHLVEIPCLW